jgi:hypothetical protein
MFDYVVRQLLGRNGKPARFRHDRGWVEFSPSGDATRVATSSRRERAVQSPIRLGRLCAAELVCMVHLRNLPGYVAPAHPITALIRPLLPAESTGDFFVLGVRNRF